ncbi:hypothetical protein BH11PLA1_BH11PLA1_08460 [soil metagenome]
MAVQRINPIEMHFEKVLVALAAAGLLGVIAWQLTDRPTVKVGTKNDVALSEAYPELERLAGRVKADMQSKDPQLPPVPEVDVAGEFAKRRAAPLLPEAMAPGQALAWAPGGLTGVQTGGPAIDNGPIKGTFVGVPSIPAPAKATAATFLATIEPNELTNAAGLAAVLPAAAPYDKASVIIEATFDGTALRKALEAVRPGEGEGETRVEYKPVPRTWWSSTEIVSVDVQRQQLMPDGKWGDPTVVGSMPGRFSVAELLSGGAADVNELQRQANDHREEILHPVFYQRASAAGQMVGDEWTLPSERADLEGQNAETKRKQSQLSDLERRARNLETAIEKAKRQPANPGRGGAGGGGVGGGGAGGPRGAGGGGGRTGQPAAPKDDGSARLERDLAEMRTRIEALRTELATSGVHRATHKALPPDVLPESLRDPTLQVWNNDLTAERGRTYRYRVSLRISNPLYGQGRELSPKDDKFGKQLTLASAPGEWSDPVTVDPEVYYFITSAGGKTALNATPNASAELYKFSYGYWRRARVSLDPGDAIAGKATTIDASKVSAAPMMNPAAGNPAPGRTPQPAGPGARGPIGIPPGAGGGLAPQPGGGRQPGGAAPAPVKADPGESLPTTDLLVVQDAFLLDVASSPESGTGIGAASNRSMQVFVRDLDGQIVVRLPEREKAQSVYKRLDASADEGEAFIKNPGGAAQPADPAPRPPAGGITPPPQPSPQRGGGPGGGGGS